MKDADGFGSFLSLDFFNLFWVPFATILISVLCRYAEKHDVFRSLQADPAERSEATFDVLKVGPDLVLLAMAAALGIAQLVWVSASRATQNALVIETGSLLLADVGFLVAVVFCHVLHHYPHVMKGMVLPNVLGFVAVYLSVAFFRYYVL